MHIYIDESGTFRPGAAKSSVSVVGALIVPDYRAKVIESKYVKLRPGLPKERGEVKGKLLSECDVASVVTILERNQAVFEVVAIDLARQLPEDVQRHQHGQAEGIIAGLTAQHHPNMWAASLDQKARLERMSPQLYVQSVVMFEAVQQALELGTMYFSQRQPRELENFKWRIDAKGKGAITDWEDWWKEIVMPALQSKSIREPMACVEFGDYSYFARHIGDIPDWLPPREPSARASDDAINLRSVLMEDFAFSAGSEFGLELVDILTNATRRALIGNLQPQGFAPIASLMIHRTQHYIRVVSLGPEPEVRVRVPFGQVLHRYFTRGGRIMIAPRFAREIAGKGAQ